MKHLLPNEQLNSTIQFSYAARVLGTAKDKTVFDASFCLKYFNFLK